MHAIPALGILGVNLTVPHKEAAAGMLKNLSAEAKLLRAVNCVINVNGKLRGDNTDARGLERDLRDLGVSLQSSTTIVIGAGGAAASAILASIRMGASPIVVANRTRARASKLVRRFTSRRTNLTAHGLEALTDAAILSSAAIVINATPMGLTQAGFARIDYALTSRECFFYDLIYAAEPTAFLRPAIALGRRAADGAGMLVNQGELAFELFNGVAPPPGVMRRALWERLGRDSRQL